MKTEEKKIRSGVGNRWRREEESLWRRKSLEKRRRFALAWEIAGVEKKNRSGVRSCWRREEDSPWRQEVAGEEKKIRSGVRKLLERRHRDALA